MRGSLLFWPILAIGAAVAVLGGAVPALAQELRLEPVDQASRDPDFAKWRKGLIEAVRRRDADYVVAHADPEIKLSFGGDYGPTVLRQFLTGDGEWQGEAYWRELQLVLELGGVFMDDGAFCTPYLACMDVPGCAECDPYETVYVIRSSAMARRNPEADGAVAAKLSWHVLPLDYSAESPLGWYAVKLRNGRTAYLSDEDARMSIDYRARFEKMDGRWRITVFISGD